MVRKIPHFIPVLHRKVLRTIFDNKLVYIGVVILVLLGSMLYTSFNVSASNLDKEIKDFRSRCCQEDVNFTLQEPLSEKRMSALESKYDVVIEKRKIANYEKDGDTVRVLEATEKINKYEVISGEDISKSGEILVDKLYADAHKLSAGDEITLYSKKYKIKGFMAEPDYLFMLKTDSDMVVNHKTFGIAIMSKDDIAKIKDGYDYYMLRRNDDTDEDVLDEIKADLNSDNIVLDYRLAEDNARITTIDGDITTFIQCSGLVPTVILIICCLLVAVFLWRIIRTEYTMIGTLFAIGYNKRKIVGEYLAFPIFISLLGGLLGTILGIPFSKTVIGMVFENKYSMPGVLSKVDPKYLLISLILPYIFMIPVTLFVILSALKLTPVNLMRNVSKEKNIGILEKLLKFKNMSFDLKFTLREVLRNIRRCLIVFVSILFASLLLLFGFTANDSVSYMYDSMKGTYVNQYNYYFNSIQVDQPEKGERQNFSKFAVEDDYGKEVTITIFGIDSKAKLVKFKDEGGKRIKLSNTVISSGIAEKLNIKEGDLLYAENKLTGKEIEVEIDKIAEDYNYYIYMPIDQFNEINEYPEGSYISLISNDKLNIAKEKILNVLDADDQQKGYKEYTKTFKSLINIVSIIAFIIGVVVINIIITISVEENKNNISMMKVLGYHNKKIISLMIRYNIFIVIAAYLLSVPIIKYLIKQLFDILGESMNAVIPVKLYSRNVLIGFLIILLTYEVSKFISVRRVFKISMVDSLKSKNE